MASRPSTASRYSLAALEFGAYLSCGICIACSDLALYRLAVHQLRSVRVFPIRNRESVRSAIPIGVKPSRKAAPQPQDSGG